MINCQDYYLLHNIATLEFHQLVTRNQLLSSVFLRGAMALAQSIDGCCVAAVMMV